MYKFNREYNFGTKQYPNMIDLTVEFKKDDKRIKVITILDDCKNNIIHLIKGDDRLRDAVMDDCIDVLSKR